ncbi:hypothetical protein DFH07DRAFT_771604 [Mycena maculata]|uniref:Uncharacterized protein n=1 Tax=Mycena maculata TaxID=230809 RepID=A0AAD7JDT7_9AGAR|nr:hypothetical protein DFH07DRAFT_771604 [Mycena maculata]
MKSPPPQHTKFPLAAPKNRVPVNYIDDEAEEEDENDSESDEEGLQLLYPDDDDEEPSVSTQSTGPIQDVSGPTAQLKKARGLTPPLRTRAMSQRAQKKILNTSGLEHSTSDAIKGAKSSATIIPAGKRNTQKRLAVAVKQEPRERVSLSAEDYDDFVRYKASLNTTPAPSAIKTPSKGKMKGPPTSQESPTRGRPRIKAEMNMMGPRSSQEDEGDPHGTPRSKSKKARGVTKRKERSPSEELSQSPKTPSKGKQVQTPSAPKKAKVAHGGPVLQTEDILQVAKLPKKCQVTNEDVQDPLAKKLYQDLPPLLKCVFLSWSPDTGHGNMMYSAWETATPYMNFDIMWMCANFVFKRKYVNLSRIDPRKLQAVRQIYGAQRDRWTLSIGGTTAVCITLAMAVQSSVTEISSVVNSDKAVKHKFITAIPHGQEIERLAGVIGMVFHKSELKAQIRADVITFGTKSQSSQSAQSSGAVKPRFATGGSKSFASTSGASSGTADALNADDEVPVYDGRTTDFDLDEDIDDLENVLSRYEDHEGEPPNGACVLIAYTVSQFTDKSKSDAVGFNLRWVVVLGEPEE